MLRSSEGALVQQVPLFVSTKKNATMPLSGIREERVRGCDHQWKIFTSHNNKTGVEKHWVQCQRCQWRTNGHTDKELAMQEWLKRKKRMESEVMPKGTCVFDIRTDGHSKCSKFGGQENCKGADHCFWFRDKPLPEDAHELQLKGEIVAAEQSCKLQKALFRAMLNALLEAEDPQTVIEDIIRHIFAYANQRFFEGLDFASQPVTTLIGPPVDYMTEAEELEHQESQEIQTCDR